MSTLLWKVQVVICPLFSNKLGDTALHIAVKKENIDMINLLFEFDCDPTKRNKRKLTAFEVTQNQELIEMLRNLHSKQKVSRIFYFLKFV